MSSASIYPTPCDSLLLCIARSQRVTRLSTKNPKAIEPEIDLIHDKYDHVVALCVQAVVKLMTQDDCKYIIVHRDCVERHHT